METGWNDRDRFERHRFDTVLVPLGLVLLLVGGTLTASFIVLGRPSSLQPGGLSLLVGVVVLIYGVCWRQRRRDHEQRSPGEVPTDARR